MRHWALQIGRINVCQNPYDVYLSVDKLGEMVGHGNETLESIFVEPNSSG